jgi:pimeloyl-ACP methyl ester carboxylesterase
MSASILGGAAGSGWPTLDQTVQYLGRSEGRIAYDVTGNGPLVICVPGMGELRSSYRFMAPVIARSGFQVACLDLRGHGDSDAVFSRYDDEACAGDIDGS